MIKNKSKSGLIIGTVVAANASAANLNEKIALKDIHSLGINKKLVESAFLQSRGINLNMNEVLKVSIDEEGKNYKFDTLDNISVIVPIESAIAAPNKTEPDAL
ncbi:MAG: hypothetical protein ACXVCR_11675 [Bdellovibrio sp.]